jgi:hypothetical protein
MEIVPIVVEGTWEELAARSSEYAGRRLRLTVLEPIEKIEFIPIEDRLAALSAEVDPAEWDKLPADLTDRLDDYIYGPRPE